MKLTYKQKLAKKKAADERARTRMALRGKKQPSKRVKKVKKPKVPVTQILRDYGLPERIAKLGKQV